jgi:hypothetical protein
MELFSKDSPFKQIATVLNTTLYTSMISLLYPGSGWADDAYGQTYQKIASETLPSGPGAELTRAELVQNSSAYFIANQTLYNNPPIVRPSVRESVGGVNGLDVNFNSYINKKSPKRTYAQDYKKIDPNYPEVDHLLQEEKPD